MMTFLPLYLQNIKQTNIIYFSEEQTMDMNIQDHNIEKAPTEIGLPSADGQSEDIQQGYDDTCAIRSQELILRDFGIPVTEDTLRQQAMDKGWYSPGSGTYLENVGNLLEMYGVETHIVMKRPISLT